MTARPVCSVLLVVCAATAGARASAHDLLAQGRTEGGGWGVFSPPSDQLSDGARTLIQSQIQANIVRLRAEGRLAAPLKAATPLFSWPVRAADGIPVATTYGISNFVDHDPALNSVIDFACGTRTYDLVGGGHRGTDIFPVYGWRKLDNEEAVVVAAAPGTIVFKQDGNQDRTCGNLATMSADATQWNAVFLRHADGSVSWYGHLKKDSLTPKKIGDPVAEGEFLGAVGSSGLSSGPHTHFEVYDSSNTLIDPWVGACNPSTRTTWWKDQPPYFDPQIVQLMPSKSDPATANFTPPCDAVTHTAAVVPQSYFLQPDYYFAAGDTIHSIAFVRDVQPGATIAFTLKRPNGTVLVASAQTSSQPYFAGGYFYSSVVLPAGAPAGQWSVDVTFAGHTQTMPFFVGFTNPAAAMVRVFDFHNSGLDHFFRTANPAEAASVDAGAAGPGWLRTGDDFIAFARDAAGYGASAVCRFYGSVSPGPNSHFYTGAPGECNGLKQLQQSIPDNQPRWNYEEIAFGILLPVAGVCPQQAPVPVYRLYNNRFAQNDSNHRYTTKSSAYFQQAALGWAPEGPVMCASARP